MKAKVTTIIDIIFITSILIGLIFCFVIFLTSSSCTIEDNQGTIPNEYELDKDMMCSSFAYFSNYCFDQYHFPYLNNIYDFTYKECSKLTDWGLCALTCQEIINEYKANTCIKFELCTNFCTDVFPY